MLALIAFPIWLIYDIFFDGEWFIFEKWQKIPFKERLVVIFICVFCFEIYRYFFIGY
jgi:hypothetical protein